MSMETLDALRSNTIQGYGVKAWHFREGVSPEPYPGPIPESAIEGLFPTIVEVAAGYRMPASITPDGVAPGGWVAYEDAKVLLRGDTDAPLAVVGKDYTVHQYYATLGDMGLPAASAGLLNEGRHAWVQYGTADTVTTPENVRFATKLLCVTSANGSLATQMRYVTTLAVCDNTLGAALREGRDTARRVRHTRFSVPRVDDMRRAFGLLPDVAEQVAASIHRDTRVRVDRRQVEAFLAELFPVPGEAGRSRTIAENKQSAVRHRLYTMWGDYAGTRFGVLQAVDTARRWDFRKSGDLQEHNMRKVISGEFDGEFEKAARVLDAVITV